MADDQGPGWLSSKSGAPRASRPITSSPPVRAPRRSPRAARARRRARRRGGRVAARLAGDGDVIERAARDPRLCGVRDDDLNLDASLLPAVVTGRTRAILPVHSLVSRASSTRSTRSDHRRRGHRPCAREPDRGRRPVVSPTRACFPLRDEEPPQVRAGSSRRTAGTSPRRSRACASPGAATGRAASGHTHSRRPLQHPCATIRSSSSTRSSGAPRLPSARFAQVRDGPRRPQGRHAHFARGAREHPRALRSLRRPHRPRRRRREPRRLPAPPLADSGRDERPLPTRPHVRHGSRRRPARPALPVAERRRARILLSLPLNSAFGRRGRRGHFFDTLRRGPRPLHGVRRRLGPDRLTPPRHKASRRRTWSGRSTSTRSSRRCSTPTRGRAGSRSRS